MYEKRERKLGKFLGDILKNGETWQEAAKRELYEEAGIIKANIKPICLYKISKFAMLCFAEVLETTDLPNYEMEEVKLFAEEPQNLSYPDAHKLFFTIVSQKTKDKTSF